MKIGTTIFSTGAGALLMALAIGAQPMVAVAAQPTIQSEEAAHPKIVLAINEMKDALYELSTTKDDFGGNKAAAIRDLRNAIHAMQKALYYRLNMDDAAIDRLK